MRTRNGQNRFDNSQRNLIVNFAYKLDDRAATEELANNLAAVVAAENTEEINRLMWEAEEKIESLPDGMIGLSEMHEYGYLKDDVLPLTKEGARSGIGWANGFTRCFRMARQEISPVRKRSNSMMAFSESRLTHGVQFCWKRTKSIWKMSIPARMPH